MKSFDDLDDITRMTVDEDRILAHLMMRILGQARRDGATLLDDPRAGPNPETGVDQWRWFLHLEQTDIYRWEKDLVEMILSCDCPSPHECGRTVRRMCKSLAEYRASQKGE